MNVSGTEPDEDPNADAAIDDTPTPLAPTPYALHELAPPAATVEGRGVPLPPAWGAARARFQAACAAYEAGRHAEAAASFLEAARTLLRAPAVPPTALAAARTAAYRNAAHALALAEGPEAAERALLPFTAVDPACAAQIRACVAALVP